MDKQKNALLLRIENAKLVEKGVSFKKTTTLEFELNDKKVKYYDQPADTLYNEFHTPDVKDELKSRNGVESEPRWATLYNGGYTNGDIWIPLEEADKNILKVYVLNGKFTGIATITLTKENRESLNCSKNYDSVEQYDLCDKSGNKIEGSFIKLGYTFGTQYEIKFCTGLKNLSPGTGVDTQILDTVLPHGTDVVIPGLYKILKYLNPLKIGTRDTEKDDENHVMFQINGPNESSNFFMCKSGSHDITQCSTTKKTSSVSTYKFFVTNNIVVPLSVSVRLLTGTGKVAKWFLEKIVLKRVGDQNEIVMPCFQWIMGGRLKTLCVPEGVLPEGLKENSKKVMKKLEMERRNEIDSAKGKYEWSQIDGLPSFLRGTELGAYDLVPMDEQFDDFKSKDFAYTLLKGLQNTLINTKFPLLQLNHVEDYHKLYNLVITEAIKEPPTAKIWNTDEFFGWSYLAGTNPLNISCCKKMPSQFAIPEIKDLMNGLEPEEQCSKGRVFLADYSLLSKYNLHTNGVPSVPTVQVGVKYTCPCTCLFYVADDSKLMPIAIQLTPDGPIFTPKDNKWQWMYAKMAVRNADAQFHQLKHHLLGTHLTVEPLSIALNRTVSRAHPVYRLLLPHLKYTVAINTLGRRGLVNPCGFADQLTSMGTKSQQFLKDCYKEWDFYKTDLPSRLAEQGFSRDDKGALTDFPYMDDGLLVWDAMYEFVGNYLQLYYNSDSDVEKDVEIKDWLNEIKTVGHAGHTFTEITTLIDLQNFLTTIMWTCSGQHSALNFNVYNMYGFIPNCPLALFKQPPKTKDEVDEKFIMESLPGKTHASIQITLMNLLSSIAENEEFLTSKRYIELIGEPKALECLKAYQDKLKTIDDTIAKRNEERVSRGLTAYTILMPSKVPNSIAI